MAGRGAKPGERRGGRQKGTPNKLTTNIKAAIALAFNEAGGHEYLVGLAENHPQAFCALLAKLVPPALPEGSGAGGGLFIICPVEQ
jgi:hypothetical protein